VRAIFFLARALTNESHGKHLASVEILSIRNQSSNEKEGWAMARTNRIVIVELTTIAFFLSCVSDT
jgi:hypothetical protein